MKKEISKIKNFWESLGQSACPDDIVRDMSIKAISDNIDKDASILDLGCGNGYCTFQFAKLKIKTITGADYSSQSIIHANDALKIYDNLISNKIKFVQADAVNLKFDDNSFDNIITIRCLINVGEFDNQVAALKEIYRVLKPGGKYIMCENTTTGLHNLNSVRQEVGLEKIELRWHNQYLDEQLFLNEIKKYFKIENVVNFASTYYLLTRVIKAWNCKQRGETPTYNDEFNKMASRIESFGEFSPMKLFILKK